MTAGPATLHAFVGSGSRYVRDFLVIADETGREVPLRYNAVQRYILGEKLRAVRAGKPLRFLIPKARRTGVTTLEQALSFALCATRCGQRAATLCDIMDKTEKVFGIARLFYDRLPPEIQPIRRHESRRALVFDELRSSFVVGTAGTKSYGRGETLQRVHGSEVAYWLRDSSRQQEEIERLVAGLTEACSHGEVVLESTAAGNRGWWYEACLAASQGRSEWTLIFVPWFMDPSYAIPLEPGEVIVPEGDREKWLMVERGVSAEQIKWRRRKSSEQTMRRLFLQEYPEILEESFLAHATGVRYFDEARVLGLLAKLAQPERKPVPGGYEVEIEAPVPNVDYAAGADTSEGIPGRDPSMVGVVRQDTGRQVAWAHGFFHPRALAEHAVRLSERYNRAHLAVERENHGHAVIMRVEELRYPVEEWSTSSITRPQLLDGLASIVREAPDGVIEDRDFVSELLSFGLQTNGRWEADPGAHDDRVFAWGIAYEARRLRPPPPRITILEYDRGQGW